MLAIYKREFKAYFFSPIAYVLIGLFIGMLGLVFSSAISSADALAQLSISSVLAFANTVLIFIVPILTMRIIAEDRKNGNDALLYSAPISTTSIILGKFFAVLSVFGVMTGITLIFPIIMLIFGKPPIPPMISGYLGFILIGASFLAIGLFASALAENQIVAAVISFVIILLIRIFDALGQILPEWFFKAISWFSLFSKYNDFERGILKIGPVIYYISFTALFVFLTIRIYEKRRWSQG